MAAVCKSWNCSSPIRVHRGSPTWLLENRNSGNTNLTIYLELQCNWSHLSISFDTRTTILFKQHCNLLLHLHTSIRNAHLMALHSNTKLSTQNSSNSSYTNTWKLERTHKTMSSSAIQLTVKSKLWYFLTDPTICSSSIQGPLHQASSRGIKSTYRTRQQHKKPPPLLPGDSLRSPPRSLTGPQHRVKITTAPLLRLQRQPSQQHARHCSSSNNTDKHKGVDFKRENRFLCIAGLENQKGLFHVGWTGKGSRTQGAEIADE